MSFIQKEKKWLDYFMPCTKWFNCRKEELRHLISWIMRYSSRRFHIRGEIVRKNIRQILWKIVVHAVNSVTPQNIAENWRLSNVRNDKR
jgi:hypothetical protein